MQVKEKGRKKINLIHLSFTLLGFSCYLSVKMSLISSFPATHPPFPPSLASLFFSQFTSLPFTHSLFVPLCYSFSFSLCTEVTSTTCLNTTATPSAMRWLSSSQAKRSHRTSQTFHLKYYPRESRLS